MYVGDVIQSGRQPWQPHFDATNLDVWHHYDVPLVGTFSLIDKTVIFAALNSSDPELMFWCYTFLTTEEARVLIGKGFESVEELYDLLNTLFFQRQTTMAVTQDLRILSWDVIIPGNFNMFKSRTRIVT